MNKQVKKKWVAALRSGKYEQGRSALRCGDKFCCLGVLCDLHRKATKKGQSAWKSNGQHYAYKGETGLPPAVVSKWAKIDRCNPFVTAISPCHVPRKEALSQINDHWKYDFNMIADAIEKSL